jgi:hypothetical protein
MSDFYKLLIPKNSLAILVGYPGADRVRSLVNSDTANLVIVVEKDEKKAAEGEAEFYGKDKNIVVVERSAIGFEGEATPMDALIDSYGVPDLVEIGKEDDVLGILKTTTYPANVVSFPCESEQDARACVAWLNVLGEYQYYVVGVDNEHLWASPRTLAFLEGFLGSDDFLAWMSRTAVFNSAGRVYAVRVNR